MGNISINLSDVQGFVLSDFNSLPQSRYVMLQVTDAAAAKSFIKRVTDSITNAKTGVSGRGLNIAFTAPGLLALGLKESNMTTFVREFREGMVTPHRQRLLGDFDSSAPENWAWGGPKNEVVHVLLLVFAADANGLETYYNELNAMYTSSGFREAFKIDNHVLPGNKEHFGFRDGIAQPFIKGSGISGKESDNINAGEFLMGYKSEYNVYPDTPLLKEKQGDAALLADDAAGTGFKDMGHNGTYLVIRQLAQDVNAYWSFLNEKTKNEDGTVNTAESKKLAAKMMGRWPSGAPIVKFPDAAPADAHPDLDPETYINDNDFLYNDTDRTGMKCPFGAHTRRANPRDSFEENTKDKSILLSNRHRIIRRARLYGEPFVGSPTDHTPKAEVGMLFACINADISRQFEFIQYTWANYPKFKQLFNDPDPFIGVRENPTPGTEQVFTIPSRPANKYITGLQRFVTVKGGGYFFFPSLTTIKYFSTI